jgi:hypothetical protein
MRRGGVPAGKGGFVMKRRRHVKWVLLVLSTAAAAALLPAAGQSKPPESDGSAYTWTGAATLTVDVEPWGGGYVRSDPYLIDCGLTATLTGTGYNPNSALARLRVVDPAGRLVPADRKCRHERRQRIMDIHLPGELRLRRCVLGVDRVHRDRDRCRRSVSFGRRRHHLPVTGGVRPRSLGGRLRGRNRCADRAGSVRPRCAASG